MLRKHIRRIPVVESGCMVGMVYISDLFDRPVPAYRGQLGARSASAKILGSFRGRQAMRDWVGRVQPDAPLVQALHRIIFAGISRLIVCGQDPRQITGVLSLSDLAHFSSNSCQACTSARLLFAD